ncbi:hypothetical protein BV20DRAFT_968072 [Pilatotrama ljubarskyi]|nr:hypothetical protein BV20DRAFT_968072 [Pilatotrama ljubarskyi]
MSPRALIFTSETLQFRCQTVMQNVGNSYYDAKDERRLPLDLFYLGTSSTALKLVRSSEGWTAVYEAWCRIVEDYSQRSVGVPSDKLVACGAIAAMFDRVLSCEYLAGLWGTTLLQDLLWRRNQDDYLQPVAEYRAPSWSWAAIDRGRIEMPGREYRWLNATAAAEVIRCVVLLKDPVLRFGEVSSGSLVLRAALIGCRFRPTDNLDKAQVIELPPVRWTVSQLLEDEASDAANEEGWVLEDRVITAWADIDCEADALPLTEQAWLVPLLYVQADQSMSGLVVALAHSDSGSEMANQMVYRRIGTFYGYDWDGQVTRDTPTTLVEVHLV